MNGGPKTDKPKLRPLFWIGSSYEDFREFPDEVQSDVGYALEVAQSGGKHRSAKPLRGMMRKFKIPGTDETVTRGTGNIWLDLGYSPEEAEVMSAKVWLTKRIHDRIKELGLTQVKAAKQLGVSQPDVSRLMNIRPTQFSTEKLMSFLRALQLDTDIVIRPKRRKTAGPGVMRVMEAAPA